MQKEDARLQKGKNNPEEVGFIDPDKVHEVNIQDKPKEVKETLLRCFK